VLSSGQLLTTTNRFAKRTLGRWTLAQCELKDGETITAVVVSDSGVSDVSIRKAEAV